MFGKKINIPGAQINGKFEANFFRSFLFFCSLQEVGSRLLKADHG